MYSRVYMQSVEEQIENKDRREVVMEVLEKMRDGFYSRSYIDQVFQTRDPVYTIYDAYAFSVVHALILTGKVLHQIIGIDGIPGKDREKEHNNAVVATVSKRGPFVAEFWGGSGDCDGFFRWTKNIELDRTIAVTEGEREGEQDLEKVTVPPFKLPLEVGLTNPEVTLRHILGECGVARWPYGSEVIKIFYSLGCR